MGDAVGGHAVDHSQEQRCDESDQEKGEISFCLSKDYSEKTEVLLKALVLGLSGIEEGYPKNFRLYTEEVLK